MIVFNNIDQINRNINTVVTIGTFDGIHRGHQEIINKVLEISKKESLRNIVVTFSPHPRLVLNTDPRIYLLNTEDEQQNILEKIGVDIHLKLNFNKNFSQLSAYNFIKEYIVEKIGVKKIVIGYDHRFGNSREGDVQTLKSFSKEFNFEVIEVSPFKLDGSIVNSSVIRRLLSNGNIVLANKMLGYNYTFSGQVVHGDGRGKTLGYPTANINLDFENKLLPMLGVYAVNVFIDDEKYNGLLNIGKRPTFYTDGKVVPEVFILDFDRNIYHKNIRVEMLEKIRDEKKFNSATELINQMNLDKKIGLSIFKKFN